MEYDITKAKVLSSLFWKLLERGGTQGIQFLITLILARILLPEDFGLIVIVTVFITFGGIIVESGLSTALIQKKEVDALDFSSVFYLNLCVAIVLYIILFLSAPLIGTFFEEPQLSSVIKVLSLTLFFGAFNSIQNAVIARSMEFKNLFISSLSGVILSGIVGILMAFADFGIWALVAQQLTRHLLVTIALCITVRWRPSLKFSFKRVQLLFSYGWKLLISSLIFSIYINLQSFIIGKMFNPALLGFYNRGMQFPSVIVDNINGSIQNVMFPALSAHQDNKQKVKEMTRRLIGMSSFIVFPMMMGLAIIAEPLMNVLLTEKWLPAVSFLQIFCAYYALWTIDVSNLQAVKAMGRSDIFFKLEIVKTVIGLTVLVISIQFGVHAMAFGVLLNGIIAAIIDGFPNRKLLNYRLSEQWKDVLPSFLLSCGMGSIIYCIKWVGMSDLLTIGVQIITGIILYVGLAKIFKIECFRYLQITLKSQKTKTVSIEGFET